jgi:hypothetical protein
MTMPLLGSTMHMLMDTSLQMMASNYLLGPHTVSCEKLYSSGWSGNSGIARSPVIVGSASWQAGSWRFEFKSLVPIAACQLRSISQRGAMRDDDLYLCYIKRADLVFTLQRHVWGLDMHLSQPSLPVSRNVAALRFAKPWRAKPDTG